MFFILGSSSNSSLALPFGQPGLHTKYTILIGYHTNLSLSAATCNHKTVVDTAACGTEQAATTNNLATRETTAAQGAGIAQNMESC